MPEVLRMPQVVPDLEPMRQNNWELTFLFAGGLGILPEWGRLVTMSLQEFAFPKHASEVLESKEGNRTFKSPGREQFAALELTLVSYIDQRLTYYLYRWRQGCSHRTGNNYLGSELKTDASLIWFAPNNTLREEWRLLGFWPSNLDMGRGDMSTGDKVLIRATFQYDDLEYKGLVQ